MDVNNDPVDSAPVSESPFTGDLGLWKTYVRLESAGPLKIVNFFQNLGLIGTQYSCPVCGSPMRFVPRADYIDKYGWRCRNAHDVRRGIRAGTLFKDCILPMPHIPQIIFLWSSNFSNEVIAEQLESSEHTIALWTKLCRKICFEMFISGVDRIGGKGVVVEIEENRLGEREISGERRNEGQWAFGGIERVTGRCFFAPVYDTNRETLVEVIRNYIHPETMLVSDYFKEYDCHSYLDFINLKNELRLTIADSNRDHSNCFERAWSCLSKSFYTTNRVKGVFDSFLAEYLWKKSSVSSKEKMTSFLTMCAKIFPPSDKEQQSSKPRQKKQKT